MADMQGEPMFPTGAQGTTPGAESASKSTKAKAKTEQAAENVRQKGHDLADTARSGVESVSGTIDTVSDYAQRAQELIATAEQRLDQFIDTAERVLTKGTKYTGTAKAWLENNKQYKDRVESLVAKYHQYSDKLRSRMQQQSEGPTLGERGHDALDTAKQVGQEKAGQLGARAKQSLWSTGRYVRENPAETLLVGTALGVLVGTAFRHLTAEEVAMPPTTAGYETGGGTPYGAI